VKISRYQIFRELARGGMGTVHLGRLSSEMGVQRVVAVKRLHAHLAGDATFVRMFLDEARLCARIRHRNVVSLLDLVSQGDELCMVLEYVEGETLGKLLPASGEARSGEERERVPDAIVAGILAGALHGLHAAHEAKAEDGTPLGIVHRDFTPQNVIVGVDGVARVVDFGVAKAATRLQTTREGQLKGKLGYMSPEQIQGHPVDRRTDVFAAGAVLWELLTGRRLFHGESEGHILLQILRGQSDPPSDHAKGLDPQWDVICERALSLSPERRFATARDMAMAIEAAFQSAPAARIGEWVAGRAESQLASRAAWVSEVERAPRDDDGSLVAAPPPSGAQPAATPPGSQISQITALATPRAISRSKGSSVVAPALALLLAGGIAIAGVLFFRGRGDALEPGNHVAEAASPPPSPAAASTASSSAEPAPSSVAPPPEVVPSASAPAPSASVPLPSAAPVPPPPGPSPRPRAAPPAKPSAGSPACRYFDPKEKIWKIRRECYQ
jgi:serine/threonine protein kinase